MGHTFRGRKVLALAAAVPLVIGLTACANGDGKDDTPKAKKTSNSANQGGGGGLLPFDGGGNRPGPAPTQSGPDGGFDGGDGGNGGDGGGGFGGNDGGNSGGGFGGNGGNGGGGGDTVRFGNTDLSSIDWEVTCLTGDDFMVSGIDSKYASSLDTSGASFLVSSDSQGKVDSVLLFGEDSSDNLSYSPSTGGGDIQLNYSNSRVQVSGQGSSFSGETMKFEIDVTCDIEY